MSGAKPAMPSSIPGQSGSNTKRNILTYDSNFFEVQDSLGCGRHALNNLLGGRYYIKELSPRSEYSDFSQITRPPVSLQAICRLLLKQNPGTFTHQCPDNEEYDINVLMAGLGVLGYSCSTKTSLDFNKTPEQDFIGYIINLGPLAQGGGAHWVALRFFKGNYYYKDSLNNTPDQIRQYKLPINEQSFNPDVKKSIKQIIEIKFTGKFISITTHLSDAYLSCPLNDGEYILYKDISGNIVDARIINRIWKSSGIERPICTQFKVKKVDPSGNEFGEDIVVNYEQITHSAYYIDKDKDGRKMHRVKIDNEMLSLDDKVKLKPGVRSNTCLASDKFDNTGIIKKIIDRDQEGLTVSVMCFEKNKKNVSTTGAWFNPDNLLPVKQPNSLPLQTGSPATGSRPLVPGSGAPGSGPPGSRPLVPGQPVAPGSGVPVSGQPGAPGSGSLVPGQPGAPGSRPIVSGQPVAPGSGPLVSGQPVAPGSGPLVSGQPGAPVSVAAAAAVTASVASGATLPSAPLGSVKAEPQAQKPLEPQYIRFGFGNEGGLAPQVFSLNDFVKKTPQGSPIPDPPDHMSPLIGNYNEFKKRFVYSENKEEEDEIKRIMYKYWKAEGPSNNEVLYHKHTISEPEENNFKIPDDNPSNKDDRKILINIFKFYKEFVGKRIHDGQNSEGRNSLMSSAYRIQEQRIDNYLRILLECKPETFIIKKEEFDGSDDYYSFLIKMFWILKENAKRKGNGRINMKDIISGFKTSNISKIGDDYYNSANTQTTGGLKLRKGIEDLYALLNKLELENEKAEKARLAAEREKFATEAERLAAELEAARVAAEAEAARLAEAERARLAEAERARLAAEAEAARLAAEAEAARLAAEAEARKQAARLAAEAEAQRLQQQQTEQQRLQQQQTEEARKRAADAADAERQERERQERERQERERQERERQERERQERERQERGRQERLRQEREQQERLRQEREQEEARRLAAAPPRQQPESEEGVGKINKDWIKYLDKTDLTEMKQYRQKASLTPAKLQQIKSNWQSQGYRTPSEGYIVPLLPGKRKSGKPFRFYKNSQNYNYKDQPLWPEGQRGGRTQMSEENNALHSLFSEQLAWEDLTKEYDSIESEYQSLLPEPGESPLHRFLKNFHVYIDENSYQELLEDADGYVELMRPELVEDLYDETQEKRNEIMRRIMPFYKRAMPHLNDSQVSPVILAHLLRKNIF
jgi:hypothetical protein